MNNLQAIQIQALLSQCFWVVLGYVACILAIAYTFIDTVPAVYLYTWVVIGLIIHGIELGIVVANKRYKETLVNRLWQTAVHTGTVCTGLYFAAALGFFFVADSVDQVIALVAMYVLIVASLLTGSAYYLPAYYRIVPIVIIPAIFTFLYFADRSQYVFLIPLIFIGIGIHQFITGFNAVFKKLIVSEEESKALLLEVSVERDRATNAMMEKNNFLALASHDLRQPIHATGLFVVALERHIESAEGQEILDYIKYSNKTVESLFSSILDLSKLDANAVDNYPVNFNLFEFLNALRPEFDELVQQKSLVLDIACDESINLSVDPLHLTRIVSNLVNNAIKYSEQGVISISATRVEDEQVRLTVQDQGIGIASEDVGSIFSEFQQIGKSNSNNQYGLGLGLAIVKRLCELIDVSITVESELGVGSVFSLELKSVADCLPTLKEPHRFDELLTGFTVVVVDDEIEILNAMSVVLKQWDCTVLVASNVEEALDLIKLNAKPSVLVADYRLNDRMNGIELIQEYRFHYGQDFPAILITGDTEPALLREFYEFNVTVLYKPLPPEYLHEALVSALL